MEWPPPMQKHQSAVPITHLMWNAVGGSYNLSIKSFSHDLETSWHSNKNDHFYLICYHEWCIKFLNQTLVCHIDMESIVNLHCINAERIRWLCGACMHKDVIGANSSRKDCQRGANTKKNMGFHGLVHQQMWHWDVLIYSCCKSFQCRLLTEPTQSRLKGN